MIKSGATIHPQRPGEAPEVEALIVTSWDPNADFSFLFLTFVLVKTFLYRGLIHSLINADLPEVHKPDMSLISACHCLFFFLLLMGKGVASPMLQQSIKLDCIIAQLDAHVPAA